MKAYPHHTFYSVEFDRSVNNSNKISLCLHVQMTSNTQTSCDARVKGFHEEASNHLQYCVMFVLKECFVFGSLLHHPPFYPAQKDGRNLAVQVKHYHEGLNIIIFDEEHK